MTLTDILPMLSLPTPTQIAVSAVSCPDSVPSYTDFQNAPAVLSPFAEKENGLVILRLFLEWIPTLKAQYDALEIPEAIFRENLKDLSIWTKDYWSKHHSPGFSEWEWVANTLRMRVFRLGRLQFEPTVLSEPIACGNQVYPAGTPVLEVHIPAGEPLDAAAVEESLQSAPIFFKTYFNKQFTLYHCHSWLLSPKLKELLPEHSRILQFQNLFTVYFEDQERQAEERVFGYLSDNALRYPENTSLQSSLKKALLEGKTVGMGQGIRVIPS